MVKEYNFKNLKPELVEKKDPPTITSKIYIKFKLVWPTSSEIASKMEDKLQKMCDQYENGIKINRILLQKVLPPKQVQDAFNEVNTAEQEKEKMINQALGDYNKIIPRARGEAEQTVQQAEGYAMDRINRAKGDISLFEDLLKAYKKAPEVTKNRIYLETMADVYPNVKQKIILDKELEGVLPLLPLSKEVK